MGKGAAVLDLGSGKGAVAVEIAGALGCSVHGVDGCAAFVESARRLAAERGVSERCTFELGDVEAMEGPGARGRFDAALMIGLWPVDRAARLLRRLTAPGGVYVIDDAFVLDERQGATLGSIRATIDDLGDDLIDCRVMTRAATARLNAGLYARLRENGAQIARERPGLQRLLGDFLRRQREANKLLNSVLRPALFVCRKGRRGAPRDR